MPVSEPVPAHEIVYGPDIATETTLRLLGNVSDKRVLELGCGAGETTVALASQGAHVIGVAASRDQMTAARRHADNAGVKVELHHGDMAELAFVRADSIDIAFSAYALDGVEDLNRVFRQVHRVLRTSAALVFSVLHPTYALLDDRHPEAPLLIRRSYFDATPIDDEWDDLPPLDHHRTIEELFTSLTRANFRVDTIAEPRPPDGPRSPQWNDVFKWLPRTLVVRARKEGF